MNGRILAGDGFGRKLVSSSIGLILALAALPWEAAASDAAAPVWAAGRGAPWFHFLDGRELDLQASGGVRLEFSQALAGARPLAMTTGDFDADGVADLACGYARDGRGWILLVPGNADAFAPRSEAALQIWHRGLVPDSVSGDGRIYEVPEAPDFLAAGDFDADGRPDLAAAACGSASLFVFRGDGQGGIGDPIPLPLAGPATALVPLRIPGFSGSCLAVGTENPGGPEIHLLGGLSGGSWGRDARFSLESPATGFATGTLGQGFETGLAVAAGDTLELFGWDDSGEEPARIRLDLPSPAVSVATGRFFDDPEARTCLAVLAADGAVYLFAPDDRGSGGMPRGGPEPAPSWHLTRRLDAGVAGADCGRAQGLLLAAHLSNRPGDDLFVLDRIGRAVVILSAASPDRVVLDVDGFPAALLATAPKLNGIRDLLLLRDGDLDPVQVRTEAATTINVNNTSDLLRGDNTTQCIGGATDCTLREAIRASNALPVTSHPVTINVPPGTYSLTLAGAGEDNNATGDLDVRGVAGGTVAIIGDLFNTHVQQGTTDRVFDINPNGAATFNASLSDLEIRDGSVSGGGGGMRATGAGDLNLTFCDFYYNQATGNGGGLARSGAGTLTLHGGYYYQNTASGTGGGIHLGGTGTLNADELDMHYNTSVGGGAIHLAGTGPVSIGAGSAFSFNGGGAGGGGAILKSAGGSLTMTGPSGLAANNAALGGGLYSSGGGNLTFTNILIQDNDATGGNGGGILKTATGTLTASGGCIIRRNTATGDGGGIYHSSTGRPTVTESTILANQAANGAGLYLTGGATTPQTVQQCSIEGNTATGNGGGVYKGAGTLSLLYNRIVGNAAATGSGVYATAAGSALDNWWGLNAGPAAGAAVNVTATRWLQLRNIPSPAVIAPSTATTLTADILGRSSGAALPAANLVGLPAFPDPAGTVFSNAVNGTLSGASTQFVDGIASATFTAGAASCVNGSADATADAQTVTATFPISGVTGTLGGGGAVTCNGDSITITVTVSGGTGPYFVRLTPSGGTPTVAGNVYTFTVSPTVSRTYQVNEATSHDGGGCVIQSIGSATVTVPPVIVGTMSGSAPVTCNGDTTQVTVTVANGTPPYHVVLTNGGGTQDGNGPVFSFSVAPTATTTYQVATALSHDANDCTVGNSGSALITVPPAVVGTVAGNAAVACNGDTTQVTVTVTNGTAPYHVVLTNGGGTQDGAGPAFTFNVSPTATTTYQVDGASSHDANGCTVGNSGSATITVPSAISYTTTVVNPSCNGASDGSITFNASGGTPPYQYSIEGGNNYQSSNIFPGLPATAYSVVVRDANGCTKWDNVALSDPPVLAFTTVGQNPSCAGGGDGSITVNASGGTPPYQYSLDGGNIWQSSSLFPDLLQAIYSVLVKDFNGCMAAGSEQLTDPPAIAFTTIDVNPTCAAGNDGSITVNASGGTGALQYSRDSGANYQLSNIFSGLGAGTYPIVVRDANLCTTAPADVTLADPPAIVFTVAVAPPSCAGTSDANITVSASGGTGALQYSLDGNPQPSNIFTGVGAGVHLVTVQDANGCSVSQTVTVTDPPALSFTTASVNPKCAGGGDGSITVNATGGTGARQYSADGGASWQASNVFANLSAGTYALAVQDANGCTALGSATLVDPPPLTFTTATVNPACASGSDGSITVTASGGTGARTYSKDGGAHFQASRFFRNLPAGTYDIVVRDANGCTAAASVTLTDPAAVTFTSATVDPACAGSSDGSITVTASGGTGSLAYSKDGGVTFQDSSVFAGLPQGTYSLVVKDAAGCAAPGTATLTDPPELLFTASVQDPSCHGYTDGSIAVSASGGTPPYRYSRDGGATFQDGDPLFPGLGEGTYALVVEDAHGCRESGSATLIQPPPVTVGPATVAPAIAGILYSQAYSASPAGPAYAFTMAGGPIPGLAFSGDGILSGIPTTPGTYPFTVTASSPLGCQGATSYSLTVSCPYITLSPVGLPSGTVGTPYSQTLSASPAGAYTFAVASGTLPPGLGLSPAGLLSGTPTASGTYSATIAASGWGSCSGARTYSLSIKCPTIVLSPEPAALPSGQMGTPYAFTFAATGGTPPFTFAVIQNALPPGLTLAPSGLISGTPTAAGNYAFTVQASDAYGCGGSKSYELNVFSNCAAITVNPATLPSGKVGTAYSRTLSASGGTAPYTFAVTAGALPAGLTLNAATGLIAGRPLTAGSYAFTITATDSHLCTGSRSYTVAVCSTITLSPASPLPAGKKGLAYSKQITASGGAAPYTFAVTAGLLPPGLTLSSGGLLSGTPIYAGTYSFTVQAADSIGCAGTRAYALTISQ